jgi:hypothetical protein
MEGSLVAYKVFTNGSTLQASEINDNLMRQSVMVFSNAAARTAAITTPLEGMLTWLEDVNRFENYNGSAWVSPFGSTLLATSFFTGQTSVAIDNVFTSDYRFYDIYITAFGSAASGLTARLRNGSTDISTTTYFTQMSAVQNASYTGTTSNSVSTWAIGTLRTSGLGFWNMSIANPMVPTETQFNVRGFDRTQRIEDASGFETTLSALNGIRFLPTTGTMTGQINIFGRRN